MSGPGQHDADAHKDAGATTDVAHWDEMLKRARPPKIYPTWHATWGRHGAFLKLIERYTGPLEGKRVAELGGAGSVRLLAMAKYRRCHVVAIDFSKARLVETERMFSLNGAQLECVHGDMFELARDGEFDLVTHWGVIEHFTHPERVLEVCARMMKPGGAVVFGMPNMKALGAALWRRKSPVGWATHIYHSDELVAEACRSAGLVLRHSFHWGAPMLQNTAWEARDWWLRAVTVGQYAVGGVGKVLPVFQFGHRLISSERGFVATRA